MPYGYGVVGGTNNNSGSRFLVNGYQFGSTYKEKNSFKNNGGYKGKGYNYGGFRGSILVVGLIILKI